MSDEYFTAKFLSKSVTLYPLNLKQIQNHPVEMEVLWRVRDKGESPFDPDRFAKLQALFTMSAQRGDPNITSDDVGNVIDISHTRAAIRAILGQNWREAQQEDAAVNDATSNAARPTSPQIGADSTPAS